MKTLSKRKSNLINILRLQLSLKLTKVIFIDTAFFDVKVYYIVPLEKYEYTCVSGVVILKTTLHYRTNSTNLLPLSLQNNFVPGKHNFTRNIISTNGCTIYFIITVILLCILSYYLIICITFIKINQSIFSHTKLV